MPPAMMAPGMMPPGMMPPGMMPQGMMNAAGMGPPAGGPMFPNAMPQGNGGAPGGMEAQGAAGSSILGSGPGMNAAPDSAAGSTASASTTASTQVTESKLVYDIESMSMVRMSPCSDRGQLSSHNYYRRNAELCCRSIGSRRAPGECNCLTVYAVWVGEAENNSQLRCGQLPVDHSDAGDVTPLLAQNCAVLLECGM